MAATRPAELRRSPGPDPDHDRGEDRCQARVPLAYTVDGDRIVIVASKGGSPTHPAWYHNVVAYPDVSVELDGERFDATATVIKGEERRRLYDGHAAVHPSFADYEKKTDRVIPVIVLERKAASAAA